VYTLLPNEEDTKDVLQEVCVSISRKFGEYDRTRPFLPWACGFVTCPHEWNQSLSVG
jgi:RNA polymerase sigma-70 factor (ECF subfamily)